MKDLPPYAFLVDLYGNRESVLALLHKHLQSYTSRSSCDIIYLAPASDASDVTDHGNVTVHKVFSNNKVEALYRAKQTVDDRMTTDIVIISAAPHASFWKQLGELLFTPIHQWTIAATEDGDADVTEDADVIKASLVQFLRGVPSDGRVNCRQSELIPHQVFTHGFSDRNGGISSIPSMRSLNLIYTSKKRDPFLVVEENRRRLGLAAGFDGSRLQMARTEHGSVVAVVGKPLPPAYDAIVTNLPEVTVAAPGADCVTIVFADPVAMAIGAAHSGWRGTLRQVAVETVKTMMAEFGSRPEDILVALGPSLETDCLEFSREDAGGFYDIDASCVQEKEGTEKVFINLARTIRLTLQRVGVHPDHIDVTPAMSCTACNPDRHFSFRRDGVPFGNHCGFIRINSRD